MGVDHRRPHIRVPEELLDRPDVASIVQEVCRERVPKGVATCRFGNAGSPNSILYSPLDCRFMKVMATV